MRKVVVNSSPLIALSGIHKLNILRELYGEIYIPTAVYNEISAKPDSICKRCVDEELDWIKIREIGNKLAKHLFQAKLHAGEVEAIILTQELDANLLIIDDALAKKHADYLGICVTGTLGVLMRAKQANIIETLKPFIKKLRQNHIYISDALAAICLKMVGENVS